MSPDQLEFGNPPPKERAYQKRLRTNAARRAEVNQEDLQPFSISLRLDELLTKDFVEGVDSYKKRKQNQKDNLRKLWGENATIDTLLPPSIAAMCLRMVGYDLLDYKPATPPVSAILAMKMGTGAHRELQSVLSRQIPSLIELRFHNDEDHLSASIDMFFRNPLVDEYEVVEFKFLGSYAYRQIKRDELRPHERRNRFVYAPSPESRKQVLLYMLSKEKEGKKITGASIIYFNRDTTQRKEAIVMWDELAKHDAEEFAKQIRTAHGQILQGQLPEPTVESPHICAGMCNYRQYCEFGREFAAGRIRREQKRRPSFVYQQAKRQAEERRQRMIDMGRVQGQLPGMEALISDKGGVVSMSLENMKEIEKQTCADCGGEMVFDKKAARGGKFVCRVCETRG